MDDNNTDARSGGRDATPGCGDESKGRQRRRQLNDVEPRLPNSHKIRLGAAQGGDARDGQRPDSDQNNGQGGQNGQGGGQKPPSPWVARRPQGRNRSGGGQDGRRSERSEPRRQPSGRRTPPERRRRRQRRRRYQPSRPTSCPNRSARARSQDPERGREGARAQEPTGTDPRTHPSRHRSRRPGPAVVEDRRR